MLQPVELAAPGADFNGTILARFDLAARLLESPNPILMDLASSLTCPRGNA